MTIWYVTTGISLIEKSRCWQGAGSPDFSQFDQSVNSAVFEVSPQTRLLRQWLQAGLDRVKGGAETAADFVASHFRRDCFCGAKQSLLPAELATLWALSDTKEIKPGDQVQFIGGASNWHLAKVLQSAARLLLPEVQVDCIGPYKLDPVDDSEFDAGIDKLWRCIEPNLAQARFVLTGGYKAILLALAFRLADSYDIQTGTPIIFYTHETPGSALIPLGRGVGTARTNRNVPGTRPPLVASLG